MSAINFKSVQHLHESLLQKQQHVTEGNQQEFIKEVREYIEQAKQAGSNIPSTRERDQVRANLRYWGNYIYSIDKAFPDTELAPSMVTEKKPMTSIIAVVIFALLVVLGGIQAFRSSFDGSAATPSSVPFATNTQSSTIQPADITATAQQALGVPTPTTVFVGSDVALLSPENGESVLPKIMFKGAYTNLESSSTIHMLLVRSDRLYPIKDFFTVPQDASTGNWEFPAALYLNPQELEKPENLAVVPAACFDNACRETLTNAVETGLAINELPSQFSFTLYRDSSRVVYRNAYQAIQDARLVYSLSDEKSFDLYISNQDGTEKRPIKITPEYSEIYPNLSPDGTKIVYVKRFIDPNTSILNYAISIMDSNGENDHEITAWTTNVLEIPQWSPDSAYISYEIGEKRGDLSYWNIHIYEFLTGADDAIFEKSEALEQHYHTWMPDTNTIIFDARPQDTGTLGFDLVSIDSLESASHFFDKSEDEIRPNIKPFENGYLFTYTSVDAEKNRNIFAVILDSDWQYTFEPIRLTFRRAGEIVDGIRIGGADYPVSDPYSNAIYYTRHDNIYRVGFEIQNGKIGLLKGPKGDTDGEHFGDLVVETIQKYEDILGFDFGYMEAFFPIQ